MSLCEEDDVKLHRLVYWRFAFSRPLVSFSLPLHWKCLSPSQHRLPSANRQCVCVTCTTGFCLSFCLLCCWCQVQLTCTTGGGGGPLYFFLLCLQQSLMVLMLSCAGCQVVSLCWWHSSAHGVVQSGSKTSKCTAHAWWWSAKTKSHIAQCTLPICSVAERLYTLKGLPGPSWALNTCHFVTITGTKSTWALAMCSFVFSALCVCIVLCECFPGDILPVGKKSGYTKSANYDLYTLVSFELASNVG